MNRRPVKGARRWTPLRRWQKTGVPPVDVRVWTDDRGTMVKAQSFMHLEEARTFITAENSRDPSRLAFEVEVVIGREAQWLRPGKVMG